MLCFGNALYLEKKILAGKLRFRGGPGRVAPFPKVGPVNFVHDREIRDPCQDHIDLHHFLQRRTTRFQYHLYVLHALSHLGFEIALGNQVIRGKGCHARDEDGLTPCSWTV